MPLPRPSRPITPDTSSPEIAAPASQTVHRGQPTKYKPSDTFLFEPRPDITAHELALLMKVFFNGIMLHHDLFAKLPDELKRHFEHRKIA